MKNYKRQKNSVFLYLLSVLYFLSNVVYVHAEDEPVIVEKYLTQEGAVLYVKNLPDSAGVENMTYQVGTENCIVEETAALEESSERIYTLILCDTSLSTMRKSADKMKEVLKDVVANRMSSEEFAVMGMGKDAQLLCDYTNDYLALKDVIDNLTEKEQKTYVFSSLYQAVEDLSALENGYKRIIVITDGVDSGGVSYGKSELEKKLEETSCPIYVLGISTKNNQTDLQSLYAISRATGAEYFTLNETENLLDIVQALSRDYSMKRIVVKFPEIIMDGSTKNSQLSVEVNGALYQAQIKITLPFANMGGKLEEESGGENLISSEQEENSAETVLKSEEDGGNIHIFGMNIPQVALLVSIMVVCVLLVWMILKKTKEKKEKAQEETKISENFYKNLNKKLAVEQEEDNDSEGGNIANLENRNPRSGNTKILGHVSGFSQEENARPRIVKLAQHTVTLTDVKNAGRNWQCRFVEELVIGRNPERCQLAITDDRAVSEQHCELVVKDNVFYVKDLDSSNGTKLNGNNIAPQKSVKISDGAILEIGQSKYQVGLE